MTKTIVGFSLKSNAGLLLWAACAATLLSACGGGTESMVTSQASPDLVASATTTLQLDGASLPDAAAVQSATPTFHIAPVLLNTPDDVDTVNAVASAHMAPRLQAVPAEFSNLSTRGLTAQTMESVRSMRALGAQAPFCHGWGGTDGQRQRSRDLLAGTDPGGLRTAPPARHRYSA